jgi:hypothetical protein
MQETRKPENWREYIEGSFKALGHFGWIWREFMGSEAQRLFVKTLLAVIVGSTFGLAWPYLFGLLIDGVQQGDTQIVIIALLAAFAFDFIWENWQCVVERLGERLGRCQIIDLDTRMTEMFFWNLPVSTWGILRSSHHPMSEKGSRLCVVCRRSYFIS